MAALVLNSNENFNFGKLGHYTAEKLPSYAIPYFIRILPKISVTGTFKHQKVDLRNEGGSSYRDSPQKTYVPFTPAEHSKFISGKSRL